MKQIIPKKVVVKLLLAILLLFSSAVATAQELKKEKRELFKDTLDGKTDLSSYIIDAKGLIPIPYLITEPALGGIGGALAALYLSPKKRPEGYEGYLPPDITAGFAMYAANESWAGGLIQIGSIPKYGIKYRVGGAYANVNLNFYYETEYFGTKELEFNINATPMLLSVSKKMFSEYLYLGTKYLYSNNTLKPNFKENIPDFITSKEMSGAIGSWSVFAEYDNTKAIFTPNKGIRLNLNYGIDDNWTASDYTYQKLQTYFNWFIPIKPNWNSGFHFDFQQAFGDIPFYLKPFVMLEGIPAARYQGNTVYVAETEQRFDVNYRWSLVGFGGLGKTINNGETFSSGDTVYNYGGGFRYFLARAFNLRAGIDIAKGPDSWGYYIVFGHKWNR